MSITTTSLDRIFSADIFTTGNGDSANAMLSFKTETGVAVVNIHDLPPSVARATADAFNEAMKEHRQEEERLSEEELVAQLRYAGRGPMVRP